LIAVPVLHEVVVQREEPRRAELLSAKDAKLTPASVTDMPPLGEALLTANDTTGESKVKALTRVPTSDETSSLKLTSAAGYWCIWQVMVVAELHEDDEQTVSFASRVGE
jgi:hypothetical protein